MWLAIAFECAFGKQKKDDLLAAKRIDLGLT